MGNAGRIHPAETFSRIVKSGALYLAVYDVTENRERTRLAKVLEAYGIRVQRSAFEVRVTRAQRETLLRQLQQLNISSGWVTFYRIDEAAKRHQVGTPPGNPINSQDSCFVV